MDKKDFSNLGDEIWSTLQDALNSNDFTRLKEEIKYTADNTLNEVRRAFKGDYYEPMKSFDYTKKWEEKKPVTKTYNNSSPEVSKKPAGRVSSILYMVFGFLGTAFFGVIILAYVIFNSFIGPFSATDGVAYGIMSLFFGSSALMASVGVSQRKRLSRFKKYVTQLGGRSFCTIKELASHLGKSEKFVAKDLRKMIDLRMFPQGHIDEEKTCILLNYEVYSQYLKAKETRRQREIEALNKKKEEATRVNDISSKELREAIESGRNYIKAIREANDAIPGEEISRKLDRLEIITEKIFNYIEKHPEQLPELHKLMNYYLPMTLKLVNGYKDLDAQPIQGENIRTAKEEIEDTLDTISIAFEKLLDDLFKDIAFDISTDISVLETMLSQEGLTESDFKK